MLTIGTLYRMPSPQRKSDKIVDGLPNFYYEANTPNGKFAFQKGIHNVKTIISPDGKQRCPLIIISSTPRKAGSKDTPWHDRYDPDHGYVKYYGDNKPGMGRPEDAPGNKILLEYKQYYDSEDYNLRMENAVPLIFFEKRSHDGRAKGNAIFHGVGVIDSVELVTQRDVDGNYFANYLFNFCVLSLAEDNEAFDWRWITDRCDPSLATKDTLRYAPASWKRWIKEGPEVLHLVRRNVSGHGLVKESEQVATNSRLLNDIYHYYDNNKHEFEYLAMEATLKVIEESGATCTPGWITKKSGDGGIDFVLRVDLGKDRLASVNIIVLGQAKCTDPRKPTNGRDIARTVARIKRGWIGSFVTTSYFSEPVQQEIKEDAYPIILINGAVLTSIVEHELFENKMHLNDYLASLSKKYRYLVRIPEDILDI